LSVLHVQFVQLEFTDDQTDIRNMSPNTKNIYISAVARFSAYHRRSPDQLGLEDIREFLQRPQRR
jgi:hypothetical protein